MLLAFLLVTFLVDYVPREEADGDAISEAKQSVIATMRQLKRTRQMLMTPLNIYTGISQSFVLADVTGVCIKHCILNL